MDNKINLNFSNSSNTNYNFNNNPNTITKINKHATKSPGEFIGGLIDGASEVLDFSEKKENTIYNEVMDLLEGTNLPLVYRKAAAESVTEVLGDKFILSSNGAKRKLIDNLDEVRDEMKKRGFNISPLLNNLINMYYPELDANLKEEYANELIDYLYTKNKNTDANPAFGKTYSKPIDEIKDILKDDNELNKYGRLLNFMIRSNGKIDLNYDTLNKQLPGITKMFREELPNELSKYGIYSRPAAQTEENYKKLWDSILNKRKKNSHDVMLELYPHMGHDIETYIKEEYGYSIQSLDKEEAIKNISGNFPSFLRKLSKIDNSKSKENLENINDLLDFLGADTKDKIDLILDNTIGPDIIDIYDMFTR